MADDTPFKWFQGLVDTFRSGIRIKQKVPTSVAGYTMADMASQTGYRHGLRGYGPWNYQGGFNRSERYGTFAAMDADPIIHVALNIYADEVASRDENGDVLVVKSNNQRIKDLLTEFYADIVNVEFNIFQWVRNLVKYGDFFLYVDINPNNGVTNVLPMRVNEVERREGVDRDDPFAHEFAWQGQPLQPHQVIHFRLLGDDVYLPYGQSVLDGAVLAHRNYTMIEDAVMVYRLVRSPERRVFRIETGNLEPKDVPAYIEEVRSRIKRQYVVDDEQGLLDKRYSALTVENDYFVPKKGDMGDEIATLAGGAYTGDIEDLQHMQRRLAIALQIPLPYLGLGEGEFDGRASLTQMDLRFSKLIHRIQRVVASELKKLGMIHLYCHGYRDDSMFDFDLEMASSSMLAVQQRLEVWRSRFEVTQGAPEWLSRRFLDKTILGLDDGELDEIEEDRIEEAWFDGLVGALQSGDTEAIRKFADDPPLGPGGGGDDGGGGAPSGGGPPEPPGGGGGVEDLFAGPFDDEGLPVDRDRDTERRMRRRERMVTTARALARYGGDSGDSTADWVPVEDDEPDRATRPVYSRTKGRKNAPGQGRPRKPGSSPRIRSRDGSGKRYLSVNTGQGGMHTDYDAGALLPESNLRDPSPNEERASQQLLIKSLEKMTRTEENEDERGEQGDE